uniref:Uncharacterized protein n=1 Tax=Chromera velia CCMP2878 TaxID=1169474 RepID=A0A0G4H816_9ALVE|eukprot:Cvel_25088.t1-p1 / transcript=Cvel_25088.t1 / gene=Cvel_25088 / organism=Chromera_velia_CCMP2878 / gene_product=hypothetical protein / transcript_product=hypothetical protein / location=Cvel_scaffold2796:14288-15535(-) / protein_length=416 / sequence_SO=supercontig / SO=protein_coding / is_pseudo=false
MEIIYWDPLEGFDPKDGTKNHRVPPDSFFHGRKPSKREKGWIQHKRLKLTPTGAYIMAIIEGFEIDDVFDLTFDWFQKRIFSVYTTELKEADNIRLCRCLTDGGFTNKTWSPNKKFCPIAVSHQKEKGNNEGGETKKQSQKEIDTEKLEGYKMEVWAKMKEKADGVHCKKASVREGYQKLIVERKRAMKAKQGDPFACRLLSGTGHTVAVEIECVKNCKGSVFTIHKESNSGEWILAGVTQHLDRCKKHNEIMKDEYHIYTEAEAETEEVKINTENVQFRGIGFYVPEKKEGEEKEGGEIEDEEEDDDEFEGSSDEAFESKDERSCASDEEDADEEDEKEGDEDEEDKKSEDDDMQTLLEDVAETLEEGWGALYKDGVLYFAGEDQLINGSDEGAIATHSAKFGKVLWFIPQVHLA